MRMFYSAWPTRNEKTIQVSVHLEAMILNDVFSRQASDSPSELNQPVWAELSEADKFTNGLSMFFSH